MSNWVSRYQRFANSVRRADWLPLFLLRLYLAPVLMQAGWTKLMNFDSTVSWFANSLELPFAELMVALAAGTEFIGGAFILVGFATRLVAIPLLITMLVAAITVHWHNGWLAIADPSSWLAAGNESIHASAEKLAMAKSLLQEHGHYDWLVSSGNFVILNNGIEFAATYFVMLLVLLVFGAGRWLSIDYHLHKRCAK